MPEKIIIDTDPGIDDAMAIFFAMAHPQIDLVGLTTTFGNVSVTQATTNALNLVAMAGEDIPVAAGAATPSVRAARPFPAFVHGDDGLGNLFLPAPAVSAVASDAARFIVDAVKACPREITLVAIGPLGNLAAALSLEPAIAGQVKRVVIMGGAVRVPGNVTPVAEANVICDPDAADLVFAADWPVTLIALDVTNRVLLDRDLFRRIERGNPRVGAFLKSAADFYIDFHQRYIGQDYCRGHDVSALVYLVEPQLFEVEPGQVNVVTEGLAVGQTIVAPRDNRYGGDWQGRPLVNVCTQVRPGNVVEVFETHLVSEFWW